MLRIENLCLSFGGINALNSVSFNVKENELVALIGPNEAGKTCFLNCISGFYRPQKGHIYFENHDLICDGDK